MFIKRLVVGELGANCYLLASEEGKEAVVIDPGGDAELILNALRENCLLPTYIINTHGHVDHTLANSSLAKATSAKILIHREDAKMLSDPEANLSGWFNQEITSSADELLENGQIIEVSNLKIEVIHTPGHTRGGICLKVKDKVFTGDTLFASGIGRTDLPGGDYKTLLDSIRQKLLTLPDETIIYPGHGESSTIGQERKENPFL
ncbi:MBL fold metallo-hydrolase [bacterium]|nr:MBL fold metallo-hydrolase [bacterium]MBU1615241.1 MBL fold metallo-hydrolase [bacterium]